MQQKQLPIGYYLKLAENCLTKGIDEIQAKHGLNRLEWQVLNFISENPGIVTSELLELMKPIMDSRVVETIIQKFIDSSRIDMKDNRMSLSVLGMELHKSCFDSQQEFRKRSVANISESEYQITIATLQKIIANIS